MLTYSIYCGLCAKKFSSLDEFNEHVRLRHADKMFPLQMEKMLDIIKCSYCDDTFTEPMTHRLHLEVVHNVKQELPYKCPKCGHICDTQFHYERHMLVEHTKKEEEEGKSYYAGKQVWDLIDLMDLNFNLGNVVKYVCRAGRKSPNKFEDLIKAQDYLAREIEKLQPAPKPSRAIRQDTKSNTSIRNSE